MGSGCGLPIAGQSPSSVTQLPILTALYAGNPTLFPVIIQQAWENVNSFFPKFNTIPAQTAQ